MHFGPEGEGGEVASIAGIRPSVHASELRRALDEHELRMHFQPVVSMRAGRIIGAEALLRWQHPRRGLLFPADFVPAAEANGMIVPIGDWVIATGLAQAARWARLAPALRVSLNVAVSQLRGRHAELVATVREQLEQTGVDPRCVCLEITETLALSAAGEDRRALDALRELGVTVALDDFSTGHADPRLLETYELDVLKIDRSHVHAVRAQPTAAAVIDHMLLIARRLRMATVVEGIETEADHTALRELGATFAQGFWYSAAVDAPSFTRLLERGRVAVTGAGLLEDAQATGT